MSCSACCWCVQECVGVGVGVQAFMGVWVWESKCNELRRLLLVRDACAFEWVCACGCGCLRAYAMVLASTPEHIEHQHVRVGMNVCVLMPWCSQAHLNTLSINMLSTPFALGKLLYW